MHPSPSWQYIREQYPDAHKTLQQVATLIYNQGKDGALESEFDTTALRPALDCGLLISSDGVLSFSDPEVQHEYLVRHAAHLALAAWDDREGFSITLDEVQHRSWRLGMGRRLGAEVLKLLVNEQQKGVISRLAEAAVEQQEVEGRNNHFWNMYALFCEALPDLALSSSALAEALDPVLRAVENDGAGGQIYSAVERLAARSWEVADALAQAFIARPDSSVAALAANALYGLAAIDLAEAHHRALLLIDNPEPILRRVGIAALGRFTYPDERHDALRTATMARLETVLAASDPETAPALARAYGNLLPSTSAAETALVSLAAQPDPLVQAQVAFVLSVHAEKAHDAAWYKQALYRLAQTPSAAKHTFTNLDHAAAAQVADNPDAALAFVEAVVLSRTYGIGEDDIDLPELLISTFSELYHTHPATLAAAITRWFAADDARLHRVAQDIVNHRERADLDGRATPLRLSKDVLDTLDEPRVVHVLTRIMGYIGASRPLAALLLSAVHRDLCSADLQTFITTALSDYVLYNFPGEASAYLKNQRASEATSPQEIDVIEEALMRSDAYVAARSALPRLLELRPPSHRVYLLRLAQQKQQAALMEESTKQSGILSLVHRAPLKHGRSFFFERDGAYTTPTPLSSFEHGMELPRGEFIDPVGQTYQRLLWRSAGLAKDEVPADVTAQEG